MSKRLPGKARTETSNFFQVLKSTKIFQASPNKGPIARKGNERPSDDIRREKGPLVQVSYVITRAGGEMRN